MPSDTMKANLAELLQELDPILMNPKRFMIATLLYTIGGMTMGELRKSLGINWGDLDTHLRRLAENGYIELWREPGKHKGLEVKVYLSELGRKKYEELGEKLKGLLEKIFFKDSPILTDYSL